MIVLINDVGSAPKINECSDSYSIVFRRRRCAVGGARIVKIIMHTNLYSQRDIILLNSQEYAKIRKHKEVVLNR